MIAMETNMSTKNDDDEKIIPIKKMFQSKSNLWIFPMNCDDKMLMIILVVIRVRMIILFILIVTRSRIGTENCRCKIYQ